MAAPAAAARQDESASLCRFCLWVVVIGAVVAAIVLLAVFLGSSRGPAYSVAVTGAAGLDPAADLLAGGGGRPLSPVFNLTLRIDNARDRTGSGCVAALSTAEVSYGDAVLARGSVPQFCAAEMQAQERGARAWGQGVALPRFLRDQLAGEIAVGEAAVDVKVRMPADCDHCYDTVFLCPRARIGGPPAPCRKEYVVQHHHEDDADEDFHVG